MQPLTEKQTQRVWSRVMSAQTAPAAAMENPAPAAQAQSETLTPEKLLSLIDGERADSALYAHLAARMKGRAQAMLRAIAQQEACHAKKLAAVYFLNTGKKACPGSSTPRSTPRTRPTPRSPRMPGRTGACCCAWRRRNASTRS